MRVIVNVTEGPAKGRSFTFEQPDCFLVGRGMDTQVSLSTDKALSRHHFMLEIAPPRCKLIDLRSSNGTFVNGVRYGGTAEAAEWIVRAPESETYLKDGDEINVGETTMKIAIEAGGRQAEETLELSASAPSVDDRRELTEPPPAAHAGTPEFPGYQIVKEVGRGSMGVVYKAVQTESGRVVAIKTLLPQVAASAAHVRTFEREIEVMRQLRHPNIVAMLEYGHNNLAAKGMFYFVLELVEGPDLDNLVAAAGGMLPLREAAPLMLGALAGLAHAHAASIRTKVADGTMKYFKGVVHRDMKAQNILLARSGQGFVAKVADFGLSKSFESAGMTDMTMPGQLAGTPTYWPREQITHYKYLYPATDVFSIAAVFYRALTGAWVRDGFETMFGECERRRRLAGLSDFLRVISSHAARPIRDRNPDIPKPVAAVIDRALREAEVAVDESQMRAKLAELRYADAGAFRVALSAALRESGIVTTSARGEG